MLAKELLLGYVAPRGDEQLRRSGPGKRIKLGFNTDELGIVTSVTDGEAAQASNLLEGDIIGGLSSEGRVNFVNKKSAKVHF